MHTLFLGKPHGGSLPVPSAHPLIDSFLFVNNIIPMYMQYVSLNLSFSFIRSISRDVPDAVNDVPNASGSDGSRNW